MNAREAAYEALLATLREERYLSETLTNWVVNENPDPRDIALAYEIANGTLKRMRSLEWQATAASQHRRLRLKRKERMLLFMAMYQLFYLDRVPGYAVVSESVSLAKEKCSDSFSQFLNALLRRLISNPPELPNDLSIRYSCPDRFVERLIHDYGEKRAERILAWGNEHPITMGRKRPGFNYEQVSPEAVKDDPSYYIQNPTPGTLMTTLAEGIVRPPRNILDLCAAPGGKLLAAHDLFPNASLVANERSYDRLHPLRENCAKYGLDVQLHVGSGESFQSNERYDLVILDVPCSNSGVLNKRIEARWQERHLEKLQAALLAHAFELVSEEGQIWYLTCSIMTEENSAVTHKYASQILRELTVLPEGVHDGGYGCSLKSTVSSTLSDTELA